MIAGWEFSKVDHLWTLSEERRDGKKNRDAAYNTKLKGLVRDIKGTDKRLILHAKIVCAWMSVCGTTVSDTVLSDTESQDFLCARYNVYPLNLQSHCDECGTALE